MVGIAPVGAVRAGIGIGSAVAGAVFSGVVAPPASTWGYHWAADELPENHYTKAHPLDRVMGTPLERNASAIDVTNTPENVDRTSRALWAGLERRDPRLRGVAEAVGCIDGRIWAWRHGVVYWDRYDDSHRWHNHLGIWRTMSGDDSVWDDLAAFMRSPEPMEDDDVPYSEEQLRKMIREEVGRVVTGDAYVKVMRKHIMEQATKAVRDGGGAANVAAAVLAALPAESDITAEDVDRIVRKALADLEGDDPAPAEVTE